MSAHQKSRVDEEDDLDDLDDVLDQFSPSAQPTSPPPPVTARASSSAQPAADADSATTELERELAAAWEAMLVEGMDAMSGLSGARPPADAPSSGPKEDDFQSRIRSAMDKLKESESGLKSSDSSASGGGDAFQSLLEGLGSLGDDGPGSEEVQGVLEAMMGQLMSKDVLYEPLKELHDKLPEYLAENGGTLSPADMKRFEAQFSCIKRLLREFEAKTYSDDDEKVRETVVELMSELQTHGSPPEEIMGPLPPGFHMGSDGLPNMPDGCNMN